jgi:isovaleryl-CoA dehydrogenase
MKTTARRDGEGGYVLNGSKMWITNGALDDATLGDAFLVYCRTGGDTGAAAGKEYSLMIVERGMPGFTLGQRIKNKLGHRASPTAEIVFDGVRVPRTNLVGREGRYLGCHNNEPRHATRHPRAVQAMRCCT